MTDTVYGKMRLPRGRGYVWLSDDLLNVYLLQRYEERDGTLTQHDGTVINGDFWRACVLPAGAGRAFVERDADGVVLTLDINHPDIAFSDGWREISSLNKRLRDAWDAAIEHSRREQAR